MIATYGGPQQVYRTGPRANFIEVRTSPPSKEARKNHTVVFKIKVLMGSITIVIGSFLVTLSVLNLYDFLNNLNYFVDHWNGRLSGSNCRTSVSSYD
jgi:hypothetical protein